MKKRNISIALGFLAAFLLWTVAVSRIDVQPIGPQGSVVGFATLNGLVHSFTGVHMLLYTITDWLSLVPVAFGLGFALTGLWQWIKRKSILKVDCSILILGGFYAVVLAVYLLFEKVVINYRPVLIEGVLEASYPSSTTVLVLCIMPTAVMQLRSHAQKKGIIMAITVFTVPMAIPVSIGSRILLAASCSVRDWCCCTVLSLEGKIMDDLRIRLETEKDYRAVEKLTREAFWNVYKPGADEHYYVHMMRSHPDFIPELAFVLEKDGEIIGNIMYTKAWLEDETGNRKEILSFGPLCVSPEYQRRKLGKILIEHSFDVARKLGYDVNINFGNPGNYVSRGFVSCKKKNVSFVVPGNFPTALLVAELIPGALEGKNWMYIPSTAADCCEDTAAVEAFDATFPFIEKKWMPSQEEFYIYSHSSVVR